MKKFISAIAALCSVFFVRAEEIKYRVESICEIPRITYKGKIQRARILYVSPTYFTPAPNNTEKLDSKWRNISFDVEKTSKETDNAVCQFRTEILPNEYFVSKFEILEKDTGEKIYSINFDGTTPDSRVDFWCAGKGKKLPISIENVKIDGAPNGALRVAIEKNSPLLKLFHIYFKDIKLGKNKNYKVRMRIRASEKCRGMMFSYIMYDRQDGNYKFIGPKGKSYVEPQVRLAKDAGIDIVTFPVQAADYYVAEGETPDYSYLDGALKSIVENNPNAKILVRIRFYPPKKWLNENPDSTLTYFDGSKSPIHASISSKKFRTDSQKALSMIIDYAEKNFGGNIIGYHPGGGNSCEWFYGDSWNPKWQGYDKSTADAWKAWLRKKYKTDGALQSAWGNPSAKIDAENVPSKEERESPNCIINPKTERRIADFNEFWQDEMLDMIDCLAAVIRQKVPQKLCVFFYGYAGEFSGMYNGPAYSGHLGLGKLLKNDKIDALCGPISYFDRKLGDGKTTMGATETILRSGKLWIDEDDTSTYLAPKLGNYPGIEAELDTREKTLNVLKRNMSHEAVRNIGSWWMDLGGNGWFNDPKLWELKAAFKKIEGDMASNPSPYEPEIALVFDETSGLYCAARGASRHITHVFGISRGTLNRVGAPFGHYLLDDFLFGKPVKSKLDVYAVAYALDGKKRRAIRERSEKSAAIFVWACGYIDLDKHEFSESAVEEATGFKVENAQNGGLLPEAFATEAGKRIGLPESFKTEGRAKANPLLSPIAEAGDLVLAKYSNGKPAVVLRGKKLFCGIGNIPAELFRHMARIAGVRIYTDSPAAVYANGTYIHVTPVDIPDGETRDVAVDVHSSADVFNALTGEMLGTGPKISLKMKKGENVLLKTAK